MEMVSIGYTTKLLQFNIGLTQRGKDAKTQRIHFRLKVRVEKIGE